MYEMLNFTDSDYGNCIFFFFSFFNPVVTSVQIPVYLKLKNKTKQSLPNKQLFSHLDLYGLNSHSS